MKQEVEDHFSVWRLTYFFLIHFMHTCNGYHTATLKQSPPLIELTSPYYLV